MKKLLLFFLTISLNAASQEFIQKKDGTKMTVLEGSIHIESSRKKIGYKIKDDKKVYHEKYKDLDYASYGGFLFKTFMVNKKAKGYFVITQHKDQTLVSSRQTRIKSRGGFESTYSFYEVAVLDKDNNLIETLSFTDEESDKSTRNRSKVVPMIKNYFPDCPKLLERVSLFETSPTDAKNIIIIAFMDDPKLVNCD